MTRLALGVGFGEPFRVSSAYGLVGREAEFAQAASAVREVSAGRMSVLVIEGEAGIGKTRLVQSIVEDARRRGLIGVPAGVVAGRFAWHLFANQLGVPPRPSVSAIALAVVVVATLVLANLMALIPARLAARTRAAVVLRAE